MVLSVYQLISTYYGHILVCLSLSKTAGQSVISH